MPQPLWAPVVMTGFDDANHAGDQKVPDWNGIIGFGWCVYRNGIIGFGWSVSSFLILCTDSLAFSP